MLCLWYYELPVSSLHCRREVATFTLGKIRRSTNSLARGSLGCQHSRNEEQIYLHHQLSNMSTCNHDRAFSPHMQHVHRYRHWHLIRFCRPLLLPARFLRKGRAIASFACSKHQPGYMPSNAMVLYTRQEGLSARRTAVGM